MRIILALLASAPAALCFAQNHDVAAQAAALKAMQAQAAGASAHAGDAALNCEQLQSEFVALAQSPNFQQFAAQQAGQAAALVNQTAGLTAQPLPAGAVETAVAPEEGGKKKGFFKKMGGGIGGLVGAGGGRAGTAAASTVAAEALTGAVAGGGNDIAGAVAGAAASQAVTGAVTQAATSTALSALGGGLLGGGGRGGAAAIAAQAAAGGLGGGGGGVGALGAAAALSGLGGGGGASVVSAAQMAQMAQAQVQAQGIATQQVAALSAVSPELMRGMHLIELAHGKTCAWAQGI